MAGVYNGAGDVGLTMKGMKHMKNLMIFMCLMVRFRARFKMA
jgi:hypothetical protein